MKKILFLLPLILALLVSGTVEAKKKKYPNGDYYEGKWKKGNPNGIGIMKYANGDTYEGNWLRGKFSGQGVMKYANGNVYDGNWTFGEMYGHGIMKYANGDVYDGNWTFGKMNGLCTMSYANGNVYEGYWKTNGPNGKGIMKYNNGTVYNGTWDFGNFISGTSNGEIPGKGFYNGEWVNGKFYDGDCKGYMADSLWYEGEIKNGEPVNGKGKGYINGNYYDGEWINNFFIGSCKLKAVKKDIISFEGTISADSIMNGKVEYKNGYSYIGELKNYLKAGRGKMSFNDIVISGIWGKDKLLNGIGNIKDMEENYSFNIKKIGENYNIHVKNRFGYQVQVQNTVIYTDLHLVYTIQNIIRKQLAQQTEKQKQLYIEKQERAKEARIQSNLKNYRGENYGIGKMENEYLYIFGDAEFQHYPTDQKDVLYGNFHVWNGIYRNNYGSMYSAKGKFKNGVKTGTWIFEERDKEEKHLKRRLTINYKNGIKSGLATLETYGKMGSKSLIKAYYNNDRWEKTGTTYYYYDRYVCKALDSDETITHITERRVNFDNNGNLHGDIYMREDDVELKERYEHGKLISSEKRNIKKGIVLSPKRGENRFNEMWKLILPAAYRSGYFNYYVDNDPLIGMTFMNFEEDSEVDWVLIDRLKKDSNK